jgi:microcystin degradation protein MlrC
VTKETIDSVLKAHKQWKKQFRDAIDSGRFEVKVSAVRKDNICQFGQWLYNLSPKEMKSKELKNFQHLHAEFHKVASDIFSLARAGKKKEALAQLDNKSEYGNITRKLVLALNEWKDKIK